MPEKRGTHLTFVAQSSRGFSFTTTCRLSHEIQTDNMPANSTDELDIAKVSESLVISDPLLPSPQPHYFPRGGPVDGLIRWTECPYRKPAMQRSYYTETNYMTDIGGYCKVYHINR
jgi:hypothetical protein